MRKKNLKIYLTSGPVCRIISLASDDATVKFHIETGIFTAGCGSVWLERLVWDQEAASSNLVTPTAVKVLPCQRRAGVVQW